MFSSCGSLLHEEFSKFSIFSNLFLFRIKKLNRLQHSVPKNCSKLETKWVFLTRLTPNWIQPIKTKFRASKFKLGTKLGPKLFQPLLVMENWCLGIWEMWKRWWKDWNFKNNIALTLILFSLIIYFSLKSATTKYNWWYFKVYIITFQNYMLYSIV